MNKILTITFLFAFVYYAVQNPWWGVFAYLTFGLMFWFWLDFVMGMRRGWNTILMWFPNTVRSLAE